MVKHSTFLTKNPFAYMDCLGGIEFYDIDHGIDDYIYAKSFVNTSAPKYHYVKIYYTLKGEPYCNILGSRIHLNNALRIYN